MKSFASVIWLLLFICTSSFGTDITQKELELKESRLELLEYKLNAKLEELNLKEDNLELSKQNVADIITFHKEGVENFHRTLNYILVLMGIVVTLATAIGGYLLERYNKRKSEELKKDIEALKISMKQSVDAISAEANIELELIRSEAKRQLEQLSMTKENK